MKNNIYIFLFSLLFLGACEDYPEYNHLQGAGIGVSTDGITYLDNEISYSVSAQNPDVTTITLSGGVAAQVPLTGTDTKSGSKTFSDSDITMSEDAWSVQFTSDLEYKSYITKSYSVSSAFSTLSPFKYTAATDTDDAIKESTGVTTATDGLYIEYSVAPIKATVTAIAISKQVVADGVDPKDVDYMAIVGDFELKGQMIQINGSDYSIGDTVSFKIMATADNGKTETTTISFSVTEP